MGKSVLVGNINIWVHRMENIMQWQQQLDNIQINRVSICPKYRPETLQDRPSENSPLILMTFSASLFPSAHIYRDGSD